MAVKKMPMVANYRDPEPKHFGWGDPKLQLGQNLALERLSIEEHLEPTVLVNAKEAMALTDIHPKILAKIKEQFKFDEGWSFYPVEKMVYGIHMMFSQNIGNCVGASHAFLLMTRIAHEVLALGELEQPLGAGTMGCPFVAYTYGAGRMAGNMLGGGDGSYCGAQIKGTMENGFLPCSMLEGQYSNLPQGSASEGRLFGRSHSEIMKWQPKAVQFDLEESPKCNSADDAIELIANKHIPLQICSGWGFAYDKFDSTYGVHLYKPSGRWSHSMQVMACFKIKGQWFIVIRNQWGEGAHKGSPEIGIPPGSFVIPIETFARWVKDSETLGIGKIKGMILPNPGF